MALIKASPFGSTPKASFYRYPEQICGHSFRLKMCVCVSFFQCTLECWCSVVLYFLPANLIAPFLLPSSHLTFFLSPLLVSSSLSNYLPGSQYVQCVVLVECKLGVDTA